MDTVEIVTLELKDWQQYRDLRLKALKEEPSAYGSTYEKNVTLPGSSWMEFLEKALKEETQWLLFAKVDNKLVGMVGAYREQEETDNAHVIAVYMVPTFRGKGIATLLMQDLLSRIKKNKSVKKIIVEVNADRLPAFNLYKNSGFIITHTYKRLLGDGKEHEIHHMEQLISDK